MIHFDDIKWYIFMLKVIRLYVSRCTLFGDKLYNCILKRIRFLKKAILLNIGMGTLCFRNFVRLYRAMDTLAQDKEYILIIKEWPLDKTGVTSIYRKKNPNLRGRRNVYLFEEIRFIMKEKRLLYLFKYSSIVKRILFSILPFLLPLC